MDLLERFPLAWCRACQRVQPTITFEVFEADDKTDYDAVDLICGECQSIIATLHAPRESPLSATRGSLPVRTAGYMATSEKRGTRPEAAVGVTPEVALRTLQNRETR